MPEDNKFNDSNYSNTEFQWVTNSTDSDSFHSSNIASEYKLLHREIAKPTRKKEKYWLNILLFLVTVISTTVAGAFMAPGAEPAFSFQFLSQGFMFSIPLLLILTVHEMGHYTASRIHGVSASLPFFIPAPNFIGTFGALIKIREPILFKNALFDIGFAGPAAGFVIALPALIIGLAKSQVVPLPQMETGAIIFGDSLLTLFLMKVMWGHLPNTMTLFLHPVGLAGWIGLLVTSINLLPLGQLDGGHIAYSFFGKRWNFYSKFVFAIVVLLSFLWLGWVIWAVMIFFIIKLRHPPTIDEHVQLSPKRQILFWISVFIWVITFMPKPISIN